LDTRLTSCVAHDGSHESQQELLDSDGCSLDTSILPNVQERIINRSGSIIKLLYANFQAFRFPDRDHLHLKCTVVVCKGKCLMVWSSFNIPMYICNMDCISLPSALWFFPQIQKESRPQEIVAPTFQIKIIGWVRVHVRKSSLFCFLPLKWLVGFRIQRHKRKV
jgi:hypothetical protein